MYFDGITVGTKVYDREGGEWEVIGVPSLYFVAALKNGKSFNIKYDGFLFGFESLGQQFFWSPPQQIEVPPRPKRMVRKVVEGWINIYPGIVNNFAASSVYPTKKAANDGATSDRIGQPYFLHHEYEEGE